MAKNLCKEKFINTPNKDTDSKELNGKRTGKSLTVFISYSWDSKDHKKWVKKLADDLQKLGVEALLDQYQLAGTPLNTFMNDGINMADKVLIIGTPEYKNKAESHKGGTNTEDQIINIHITRNYNDPKFIPILRSGTFETSFTDLVGNRKGFDFTDDLLYNDTLEDLFQNLSSRNNSTRKKLTSSSQETYQKNRHKLRDLFVSIYIPYFTNLFNKLEISNYKYWSYMIAVSGEMEISYKKYFELKDFIDFCDSCQNHTEFKEYYNLTMCLQEVLKDMFKIFDLHSVMIGKEGFRYHKYYKDHPWDPELNPIEEKEYEDEILLMGDLVFEFTRIANLLLERIRIYEPSFMAQYGILTIKDSPNPKSQIVYKPQEKSDSPYPGLLPFLNKKMTRTHHYKEVDLYNSLKMKLNLSDIEYVHNNDQINSRQKKNY